ncbi:MAG TPA: glycoside hydrolase family 2 TIM barrel-domain containing protein, partial [bacterium]
YKDCTLTVKAQIQRAGRALSGSPFAWELAVSDSTGRLLGRARLDTLTIVPGSGSASVSLILEITNVELWSPEQPTLYQLRCSIIQNGKLIDEFISSLGFCEFVAVERDFLLNGQPYRVKGLDWYENYENSGPVADITAIRHRVQLIKETGANAVRVVGLPPHPSFLSTCDELGLLVFQELPLNFVPDNFFLIQEFKGLVARYLDEMLKRDALHVSFAGLGLGCDLHLSHPAALDAVNNLIVIVRKQLQRPTYLAYRFLRKLGSLPAPAVNFIFVDGYNREPEDVIEFLNYLNSQEVNSPRLVSLGFPLLLADEGGTLSFYQSDGLQPTAAGLTPPIVKAQHRQASRLERALARIDSTRLATGIFIHTIADWREAQPNLIFARRPAPDLHLSGIISRDHGERVAHEVVRSFFGSGLRRMTAALPVPSYNPIIYPISGLGILLLFLFNLNRDSRLRSGLRRVFLFPHGFHMELRERRKVPFAHTAMLSFVVCMLLSIVVSSILFRLRYDLLFNSVLNLFIFSFSLKLAVIRLIWNPLIFIPVLLLSLYALYFFLILFLKTLDYIVGENLPLRQFFTVVFWDSANFVWLLPIVPIYHRIISQTNWAVYAIALVMLFALWTIVRLLRAIRVLYNMTLFGTTFMVMILGLLILGGVWWYVDQRYALFDYL